MWDHNQMISNYLILFTSRCNCLCNAYFQEISGITEDGVARNILESNGWDLEVVFFFLLEFQRAVNTFMGYGDSSDQQVRRRNETPPVVRRIISFHIQVDVSSRNQHIYHTPPIQSSWHTRLFLFTLTPIRFIQSMFCGLFKFLCKSTTNSFKRSMRCSTVGNGYSYYFCALVSFIWPNPRHCKSIADKTFRNFVFAVDSEVQFTLFFYIEASHLFHIVL